MQKLNCIIIDDEPFAIKGLKGYVEKIPYLNLLDTCESALELTDKMEGQQVDLLFLDIQMPFLTGIDFLKSLNNPPLVIFTTAYQDYAIEGYELNVIDYLLKPISFQRFLKASNKAKDYFILKHTSGQENREDYFFVKTEKRLEKVEVSAVLFVESLQNYIVIHTTHENLIVHMTLKEMASYLPVDLFVQTHRSYLVAIDKIKSIEGNQLLIPDKHLIPISKHIRESVLEKIINNQLLKRK